jgi:hypothetical protein
VVLGGTLPAFLGVGRAKAPIGTRVFFGSGTLGLYTAGGPVLGGFFPDVLGVGAKARATASKDTYNIEVDLTGSGVLSSTSGADVGDSVFFPSWRNRLVASSSGRSSSCFKKGASGSSLWVALLIKRRCQ